MLNDATYFKIVRKTFSMAAQPRERTFSETAAVPLDDGRADDYTEKVCQTGGTAGIVSPRSRME